MASSDDNFQQIWTVAEILRDLNYSDLILTARIFSLCKDERMDFM